jgi:hypothetical protein
MNDSPNLGGEARWRERFGFDRLEAFVRLAF